jgi:hypothetical protein
MEITRPKWILVTHMFNHQTHHRGQVHCMITQCGLKPRDTDLPFMMPASVDVCPIHDKSWKRVIHRNRKIIAA